MLTLLQFDDPIDFYLQVLSQNDPFGTIVILNPLESFFEISLSFNCCLHHMRRKVARNMDFCRKSQTYKSRLVKLLKRFFQNYISFQVNYFLFFNRSVFLIFLIESFTHSYWVYAVHCTEQLYKYSRYEEIIYPIL